MSMFKELGRDRVRAHRGPSAPRESGVMYTVERARGGLGEPWGRPRASRPRAAPPLGVSQRQISPPLGVSPWGYHRITCFFVLLCFFWQDRPQSEGRRYADPGIKLSPATLKVKVIPSPFVFYEFIAVDRCHYSKADVCRSSLSSIHCTNCGFM